MKYLKKKKSDQAAVSHFDKNLEIKTLKKIYASSIYHGFTFFFLKSQYEYKYKYVFYFPFLATLIHK